MLSRRKASGDPTSAFICRSSAAGVWPDGTVKFDSRKAAHSARVFASASRGPFWPAAEAARSWMASTRGTANIME
jgi:hypothetical protein